MRKRKGFFIISNVLTHSILLLFSLIIAFPFIWMLTNSIKTKDEIWAVPPKFLPAVAQWVNYTDALKDGTFFHYMWNSLWTSVLITVIILVNSAMFAYAITNIQFKGRNLLFLIIMVTYIMPGAATHVPSYIILAKAKLIDSHAGYVLSMSASIFSIFYFRQMFLQIDQSIKDSARVDGAGHFTILWRIISPMSVSSFATLGILSFIGCYNAYVWPSLILKSKENYLISMGLKLFFSTDGAYGLKWGSIMAACCVIIFPLLILFLVGEKWIINGITSDSATKG